MGESTLYDLRPDRPTNSSKASADEDVEERSPSPPAPTTSEQRGSKKNQNSEFNFNLTIPKKYEESEIEGGYKFEAIKIWKPLFHSSAFPINLVRYLPGRPSCLTHDS